MEVFRFQITVEDLGDGRVAAWVAPGIYAAGPTVAVATSRAMAFALETFARHLKRGDLTIGEPARLEFEVRDRTASHAVGGVDDALETEDAADRSGQWSRVPPTGV